jgi:hypothetical protein
MRNRGSIVAALALLIVLAAPASADWENPTDDSPVGGGLGLEEMIVAAQWGVQIAQVAL